MRADVSHDATQLRAVPRRAIVLALMGAALAGLAVAPWLAFAASSGFRLFPVHDIDRDFVVASVWGAALTLSILAWPAPFDRRLLLMALWCVKTAVALAFMLLYESHYDSLDAFGYFQAAMAPDADW